MSNCPHCGKAVAPNLDNCPYCMGFLRQGGGGASPPKSDQRSQTCPNCDALVQPGDIICVACGTNLLTGQVVTDSQAPSQQPKRAAAPSGGPNWVLIGAVAGVLILIAIIVAVVITLTADPVARAIQLERENQVSQALQILEGHVERNGSDIRAYQALGRMYWNEGQMGDAADAFERVVQLDSARRDAAMLAVAAMATNATRATLDRQAALLETALAANPDDLDAWKLKAAVEAGRESVDGQIEALQEVVRLSPADADARRALAIALAMGGLYVDARTQLGQAGVSPETSAVLGVVAHLERNDDEATYHFAESLSGLPADAAAAVNLQQGLIALAEGNVEEAGFELKESLQDGRDPTARYFDGVAAQLSGRYEEAEPIFRAIIESGSEFAAESGIRLAEILIARGSPGLAGTYLDRAEREGARGPALHTARGRVFMLEGDIGGAQSQFNRATTLDVNYAPAYLEKGLAYIERGLTEDGIRELERYLQLADSSSRGMRVPEVTAVVEQLRKAMGSTTL